MTGKDRQPAGKSESAPQKQIASNRKAHHDYFLSDFIEAGVALTGTEVKSCRLGNVNLRDSFASVEEDGVYLVDAHISPYDKGNRWNHEPTRRRRLLLHKREIHKLATKVNEKGFTVVPTRMYFSKGRAKVELALAKGKHSYDKRESIRDRDVVREAERELRQK